jgi:hypothetical protein
MGYLTQNFQCDICGRQVSGQDGVRNVVSIENGEGSHNYPMVCDKDAKAIIGFIEELKPIKRS